MATLTSVSQPKSFFLTAALSEYLLEHSPPLDDALRWLIEETGTHPSVPEVMRSSAIPPEQGHFMTLITAALGVESAVEIGTFTGYSSICIARGLPPTGRLLCCDVSEEWAAIARSAWERAGVADRIELRLGPATETIQSLALEPTIDLAFIDADKAGYPAYYEALLPRMSERGLILADNTLWRGEVLQPAAANDSAELSAIRAFNDMVAADDRVESMILTIGDGLTLIRKRGSGGSRPRPLRRRRWSARRG